MSIDLPKNRCYSTTANSDYDPIGTYTILENLRVYTVGSREASRGILLVTDGLSPQRLESADLLAKSNNALVLVPDYCSGKAPGHLAAPVDAEGGKAKVHNFTNSQAYLQENTEITQSLLIAAKLWSPNVTSWGVFGLCSCLEASAMLSKPEAPFTVGRTIFRGYMVPLLPSCITSVLDR